MLPIIPTSPYVHPCGPIVAGVDGRKIREAVCAAADAGYVNVATDATEAVPTVLRAVNEIALAATAELAEEAGYGEGARLATSRRAMLAAIQVVAQALQEDLPGRVKDLRDEGVTWREIGQLLDLTPEGAQRRFDAVAGEKAREASRRARTSTECSQRSDRHTSQPADTITKAPQHGQRLIPLASGSTHPYSVLAFAWDQKVPLLV